MAIRTIEQVKRDISKTPVIDCDFRLGDVVTYTNDYGVSFPGKKIIGFDHGTGLTFKYGSHIYITTDCYWSPVKDGNLTLESRLSDEAYQQLLNEKVSK